MPFTELWLSAVSANAAPGPNGYDSPSSFSAPVAFCVKIARYSSGDALKYRSTSPRVFSTSSPIASDVRFFECGLP